MIATIELKFKEGQTTFLLKDGGEVTIRAVKSQGDTNYFLNLNGVDVLTRTGDQLYVRYGNDVRTAIRKGDPVEAIKLVTTLLLMEYRSEKY